MTCKPGTWDIGWERQWWAKATLPQLSNKSIAKETLQKIDTNMRKHEEPVLLTFHNQARTSFPFIGIWVDINDLQNIYLGVFMNLFSENIS